MVNPDLDFSLFLHMTCTSHPRNFLQLIAVIAGPGKKAQQVFVHRWSFVFRRGALVLLADI